MHSLGMLGKTSLNGPANSAVWARSSYWVRAPAGGILHTAGRLGAKVIADDKVGSIADPFGQTEVPVTAGDAGILIGRTNLPVVNQGDG